MSSIATEVVTRYKGNTKIIIRCDGVTVKVRRRDGHHTKRLIEIAHHLATTKNYPSTMRSKVQVRANDNIFRMHFQNATRSKGDKMVVGITGPIEPRFPSNSTRVDW